MSNNKKTKRNISDFNIDSHDKEVLVDFYNQLLLEKKQESYLSIIRKLCLYLEKITPLPLSKWNLDMINSFLLWSDWELDTLYKAKSLLEKIFLRIDKSVDITDVITIAAANTLNTVFYSFKHFNDVFNNGVKKEFEDNFSRDLLTKYSVTQALCYLLWLGISPIEISSLTIDDYDKDNSIIKSRGKIYSFSEYPDMISFFKQYIYADRFNILREGKLEAWSYNETPYILKRTRASAPVKISGEIQKVKVLTSASQKDILLSGAFDRLFHWEQNGGVISSNNLESISEEVRYISTPIHDEKYSLGSPLNTIVALYPIYKKNRIEQYLVE